jgi:hypothetical protein
MGTTRKDIWNMSLAKAGISRQVVDDKVLDSPVARTINMLYEPTLLAFLQEHSWNFAKRILPLTLSDYDHIQWEYVYEYPDDCLSMRLVTSKASVATRKEIPVPYEIFTNEADNSLLIGTDEADAYGIYTTNAFSETTFPPNFVQAFSTRLAAEIAISLQGDRGKHLDLLEIAAQLAEGTKEQNANENIQVAGDRDSKYTRSRL